MIYAIVAIKVTNPDSLAQYSKVSVAALKKHGGAIVSAGQNSKVIEGSNAAPDVAAVLSFSDEAGAEAWIADPELKDVHSLRRGSGEVSIVLVK